MPNSTVGIGSPCGSTVGHQARSDQLLELLGEHMLKDLGLGVHTIPGHPELLGEEQLEQPMVAQHLKRDPATLAVSLTPW